MSHRSGLDGRNGGTLSLLTSGITPAELSAIFERFYHASPNRREPASGAGLGSAIVKRILDLHGSRIEVDSTPQEGSTFRFDLAISDR